MSLKGPAELMNAFWEAISQTKLNESEPEKKDKAWTEVAEALSGMKAILGRSRGLGTETEEAAQLAQEFYNFNAIELIMQNLQGLDSEAMEVVVQIYDILLKRMIGHGRYPTVDFLVAKKDILFIQLKGYENHEIVFRSGLLLRKSILFEPLAKIVLNSNEFFDLFKYISTSSSEIASDAFSTFKDLVTRHKAVCATFLEEKYERFFSCYGGLLHSSNKVIKRQSVKLLAELMLDRNNFTVMERYINNSENLKLIMAFLRDEDRDVQFEAFHIFKIFVASPNKSQEILDILLEDKDGLLDFIRQFQSDRTEDEQFNDEKNYLLQSIQDLNAI